MTHCVITGRLPPGGRGCLHDLGPILHVLGTLLANVGVILLAVAVTRSTPRRALQSARGALERVEDLEAAWRKVKLQLEAEQEGLQTLVERVETKRRSAAAAASRANGPRGAPDPQSEFLALREQLIREGLL